MKLRALFVCVVVCLFAVGICLAQDPVKVDSKHYKVESENAQVRIVRVHYGPHEKSVMHSHPDLVVTYLSDGSIRMHTPDGKSQDMQGKVGQTLFTPAGTHLPENISDKDFNAVLVELKSPKTAAAKKK
jgi:quercetin dioxygenase-like cupin family protein